MSIDWDRDTAWRDHLAIMAERDAEPRPTGRPCKIVQLSTFYLNSLYCETHYCRFDSAEGTLTQHCPWGQA